jgi:hypothetical protein
MLQSISRLPAYAIGLQEALGLDILVHGEAERTDMVFPPTDGSSPLALAASVLPNPTFIVSRHDHP